MRRLIIVFLCILAVLSVNVYTIKATEIESDDKLSRKVKEYIRDNNLAKEDFITVGVVLGEVNNFNKPKKEEYYNKAISTGDFKTELHNYRDALKRYNQNYIFDFKGKITYEVLYSSRYSSTLIINIAVKDLKMLSKYDEVQSIRFLANDYRILDASSESSHCPDREDLFCTVNTPTKSYNIATGVSGVQGSLNDGDGITVGILEKGKLDVSNIEFQQKSSGTLTIDESPLGVKNHATDISIIIAGGLNGIVPHANIVHEQFESEITVESFLSNIENLIEANINVINMSSGFVSDGGEYDEVTFLLDILLRDASVTFVKSAGNKGNRTSYYSYDSDLITSPGSASNIIVVGSTDNLGTKLSTFSSTKTVAGSLDDGTITQLSNKPDILAPGGQEYSYEASSTVTQIARSIIEVPNSDSPPFEMVGTSLAAPQVTGIIAMMMDQRELLMFRPALVKALLVAGANQDVSVRFQNSDDSLNSTSCNFDTVNGFSDMCGFGLVDAEESLRLVQNQDYKSYSNSNFNIPTLGKLNIYEIEVSLNAGETVIISNAYLRNHSTAINGDNTYLDMSDIDIQVTGYSLNIESSASNYNTERISFVVPTSGKYKITVWLDGVNYATDTAETFLDNIGYIVVNAGRDVVFSPLDPPIPPPCKPNEICAVT